MASSKQYRDIEIKLNDKLYENIYLLNKYYPPTDEFKTHFKRSMFMNKNKAGFFQVVHYLLSVLNPDLTKQKLTSWPPYDIRRESKFRTELIRYVSELNTLYDGAEIPVLMTSHLITPGGMKCVRFLHKLSQLVMFQHLNKISGVKHLLMAPLKNGHSREMTDAYLDKLKTLTNTVEQKTRNVYDNFHQIFAKMVNNAEELIEKKSQLNIDLAQTSEQYQRIMKEYCNDSSSPDLAGIHEKITNLRQEIAGIHDMKIQIKKLEELVTYLNESKNILAVEKDVLKLPEDIECIFSFKSEEFNLVKFLNALHIYLEKMALHIPVLPSGFLNELEEKVQEINESFSSFNNHVEKLHDDIIKLPEKFLEFKVVDSQNRNIGNESDLAVPLPLGSLSL